MMQFIALFGYAPSQGTFKGINFATYGLKTEYFSADTWTYATAWAEKLGTAIERQPPIPGRWILLKLTRID